MRPLERKEIIYIIYIAALVGTMIMLGFAISDYLKCADAAKYYNSSICTGCKMMENLHILVPSAK